MSITERVAVPVYVNIADSIEGERFTFDWNNTHIKELVKEVGLKKLDEFLIRNDEYKGWLCNIKGCKITYDKFQCPKKTEKIELINGAIEVTNTYELLYHTIFTIEFYPVRDVEIYSILN